MRVSLSWISEYLDFELPDTSELVEKIGAQLGAVEDVIDIGARYQGIVIVKILSCTKVPDSDHLNLCVIDDGGNTPDVNRDENGHVQVVCGAPNVRAGLMVSWLPPGSTVPSSIVAGEPFVLTARTMRGVVSNGMLASARELAIGDSHEGILEIDGDVAIGADFAETFQLNDQIIDIENKMFTHRPDCFGQLGVAREVAGILGKPFHSPEWFEKSGEFTANTTTLKLHVQNELPELVPRFTAIVIDGIQVGPSPVWLQTFLIRVGVRPINNIVDVTNYIMMLTGQPLHAYDYDKVVALCGSNEPTLTIRNPHSEEKITLLNGKEVSPRPEGIMIAAGDHLVGIGGVMGGENSEVDEQTTRIILECATFDMYSIRRTSMAQGLFSEAVTRFNKGQSPLQNIFILKKAADMMFEAQNGGGSFASELVDDSHVESSAVARNSIYSPIKISSDFVNQRLGLDLDANAMNTLLTNVEFHVESSGNELIVLAPFWRTDMELREDVVEEVGRLYGFDHLPLELPNRSIVPSPANPSFQLKSAIRDALSRSGANELLTYSFIHGNLIENVGQDTTQAYRLSNALSPDLQYYRLSLLPSLLDKVHPNLKNGYKSMALFELGKVHNAKDDLGSTETPKEYERLALVFSADDKLAKSSYQGAPYYESKYYLTQLLESLGIHDVVFETLSKQFGNNATQQLAVVFEPQRTAQISVEGKLIGVVGEFSARVRQKLKLPNFCSGFELDVQALQQLLEARKFASNYHELSKFPSVEQDICFRVDSKLSYQDLADFILEQLNIIQKVSIVTLSDVDIYQKAEGLERKQVTYHLSFSSNKTTMTDSEVNGYLDKLSAAATQTFDAERV